MKISEEQIASEKVEALLIYLKSLNATNDEVIESISSINNFGQADRLAEALEKGQSAPDFTGDEGPPIYIIGGPFESDEEESEEESDEE